MKILVTGGAGFIGSHLVEALIAEGATVRVLDNLSTGRLQNLSGLSVELVEGDISDYDTVQSTVSGCELIFHQAALVSVPLSIEQPLLNHHTNVTGTFNVFESARQAGIRRIVYASSAAIYGNLPNLPKHETDIPSPMTPYAAAKLMNETLASAYSASYQMEIVGLRYMNVFGPRQLPSSSYSGVISLFCKAALQGNGCTVYGNGQQTRDFVYVTDIVQANLLAARISSHQLPEKAVFNVGRGQQTSLNQLLASLNEITKESIPTVYKAERPGDIRHSVADINRAKSILGFNPTVNISTGLRETLNRMDRVDAS